MAAETRTMIIDDMDLQSLIRNKTELTNQLNVEAMRLRNTIGTDRSLTVKGLFLSSFDLLNRAVTKIPSALYHGQLINSNAEDPAKVLAGVDTSWSREAQRLAAALAYTNTRIAQEKQKLEDVETRVDLEKIREDRRTENPVNIADYYNKLVKLFNESKSIKNDPEWKSKQLEFIKSIKPDVASQLIDYGLEGNRYITDFKES